MNKKDLVYNSEHYTVMANDIVKGKQDMSLQEARIIRLLVTQVVKEDKDFRTYTCKITDLAEFLKVDSSNLYRDIQDICVNLMQRVIHMKEERDNPKSNWKVISWMSMANYDKSTGLITLELSDKMKPYLLDLNAYFTQYQLENILEMKSYYGIRLYELLKADYYKAKDDFHQEYTIKFLREFFNCEKKYKLYGDFKKRVIQTAIDEINDKSDIYIQEFIEIKTGRKITSIDFVVSANYKKYLSK